MIRLKITVITYWIYRTVDIFRLEIMVNKQPDIILTSVSLLEVQLFLTDTLMKLQTWR